MSPNNWRYITHDGGPPNGGRPPRIVVSVQGAASDPPPPPPYSAVGYQMPAMMGISGVLFVPQATFRIVQPAPPQPAPAPSPPQVNLVWTSPPQLPPPPASPSKPEIPGETHRGSQHTFKDGTGFLFPERTTLIHFIVNGIQPWTQPNKPHAFISDHVDVSWTVRTLLKRLGIEGKGNRTRGVAECFEAGNGTWTKGATYLPIDEEFEKGRLRSLHGANLSADFLEDLLKPLRKHDGCDATLESLGWDNSRGTTAKPVWLAACDA